jgi:hypothetical protein
VSDPILLIYASKMIRNHGCRFIVMDSFGIIEITPEISETIRQIEETTPGMISVYQEKALEKDFLDQQDLMLIGIESWKKAVEAHSVWLSNSPSVLIVRA